MPASAEALAFHDGLLVGHAAMDREHRAFVDGVNALLAVDDGGLPDALQRVAQQLRAHFALEERLLEQHRFPAGACHAEEHGKVLASLAEVQALVAQRATATGRALAQALADWFPGHAETMDAALATWVLPRTDSWPSWRAPVKGPGKCCRSVRRALVTRRIRRHRCWAEIRC